MHCEICNEVFNMQPALTNHLAMKHKISSQMYYDKYLKKKGEGTCPVCGKPTTYRSISKGYFVCCSIECANKYKENRCDGNVTMTCQECGEVFNGDNRNRVSLAFGKHLKNDHKISQKDYYDKYLRKKDEGICPICGKETVFEKLSKGYRKYCSVKCQLSVVHKNFKDRQDELIEYESKKEEEKKRDEDIQAEFQRQIQAELALFEGDRATCHHCESEIEGSFAPVYTWLL